MQVVRQGCLALTGYAPEALIDNQQVSWEKITLKDDRLRVREEMSVAARPFCSLTYIHYCSGQVFLYSHGGGQAANSANAGAIYSL